jgi:hypothetical protein
MDRNSREESQRGVVRKKYVKYVVLEMERNIRGETAAGKRVRVV